MLAASLVTIDIGNSECVKETINSIVYLLFYLFFHLLDVFGHVFAVKLIDVHHVSQSESAGSVVFEVLFHVDCSDSLFQ